MAARYWDLLLVTTVVLFCQVGVFYLQAWRCHLQHLSSTTHSNDSLLVLVVTDVHLLGKRRRSWIERWWVDWQVQVSVRAAVDVHEPEVALVLGDQFDEGGRRTLDSDWDEYTSRFFRVFTSFLPLKTMYLVGNHDVSFGHDMQMKNLQRFEVTFGAANRIEEIQGHTFVSLNTMALDTDVTSDEVQIEARSFLKSANSSDLRARTIGSVVLLTHLPLFREDDLQCGEERLGESGHVTYEHPSYKYEIHHHVLSRELSAELLSKLQPDLVLSGHTHAWCAYRHPGKKTMEYTIPAFSWGQRPDPSYALLQLSRSGHIQLEVSACHLPHESFVFATYAMTLIVILLAHVVKTAETLRASKIKTKGA